MQLMAASWKRRLATIHAVAGNVLRRTQSLSGDELGVSVHQLVLCQGVQQPLDAGCATHASFIVFHTALAIAAEPAGLG
jgi:hypothetical protein